MLLAFASFPLSLWVAVCAFDPFPPNTFSSSQNDSHRDLASLSFVHSLLLPYFLFVSFSFTHHFCYRYLLFFHILLSFTKIFILCSLSLFPLFATLSPLSFCSVFRVDSVIYILFDHVLDLRSPANYNQEKSSHII